MRVYQGDPIDKQSTPHTFVEVEKDSYLEIECPRLGNLAEGDKQRLRAFTRKIRTEQKKNHIYHIRLARRYFETLYPVPNLRLVGKF